MLKLFSRSKRSKIKVDFGMLKADMHSHLIPGIDDGSPDIETSLQLIRGMMELGYKKLITTPHVMWDMYRNSRQIILEGFEQLQAAVKTERLDVELNAAAEYFLDEHVEELIKIKNRCLLLAVI
jgi:tyrosine-protein phosphatase YwqE